MKVLILKVEGETQRDLYEALRQVTDMVDAEFKAGSGEAPCFSFDFSITDMIDLLKDGDVVDA